jgi:hypothetical protein
MTKAPANPRKFASAQEELMFKLSEVTFGEAMLFQPHLYGMGKEPADVVWIADRCAVLMYMTESKKPFLSKRDHNIKQSMRWLKKWRAGEQLTGTVRIGQSQKNQPETTREVSISFDEIDHVLGLSIVDGGEVYCQYHERLCADYADLKLSACGTITGSVMRLLADTLANPRMLLYWLRELRDAIGHFVVHPDAMMREIKYKLDADFLIQQVHLNDPASTSDANRVNLIHEMLASLSFLKNTKDAGHVAADLLFSDFAWLAMACASACAQITSVKPGSYGPSVIGHERQSGIYHHYIFVCRNSNLLVEHLASVLDARAGRPGIDVFMAFDAGPPIPVPRMITVAPCTGPSELQKGLEALKREAIGRLAANPRRQARP